MKNTKVSGLVFYLFGLVIVLLIYYYVAFIPFSAQIKELDKSHAQATEQVAEYNTQLLRLNELQSKIAGLKADADSGSLKSTVTAGNVADDVNAACTAVGVVPSSLQSSAENVDKNKLSSGGKPLCSVSVSLNLQCGNAQLLDLLNYFENTSRGAYYVEKVSWTNGGPTQQSAQIAMTLYYFGPVESK